MVLGIAALNIPAGAAGSCQDTDIQNGTAYDNQLLGDRGGIATDVINGNGGNDSIAGGECADQLHGDGSGDRVMGQAGADSVQGDADGDNASANGDHFTGGFVSGGAGNDTVNGNDGQDRVEGGGGGYSEDWVGGGGGNYDDVDVQDYDRGDTVSGGDGDHDECSFDYHPSQHDDTVLSSCEDLNPVQNT